MLWLRLKIILALEVGVKVGNYEKPTSVQADQVTQRGKMDWKEPVFSRPVKQNRSLSFGFWCLDRQSISVSDIYMACQLSMPFLEFTMYMPNVCIKYSRKLLKMMFASGRYNTNKDPVHKHVSIHGGKSTEWFTFHILFCLIWRYTTVLWCLKGCCAH